MASQQNGDQPETEWRVSPGFLKWKKERERARASKEQDDIEAQERLIKRLLPDEET
mgnify:CR=1 FL=1